MGLRFRKGPPSENILNNRSQLRRRLEYYRPAVWLVFLSSTLVLFLIWMPNPMRLVIWHGLIGRGVLSGMLLLFGLVAVSLVWSSGQSLDEWAFLFFNLKGWHPGWLDTLMLTFTQLGNGITALLIGLILFLFSDRLGAYELILGTLSLWIVVELLKALVRRSRPFLGLTQARIVGYRPKGRSFPSGHTSQAFFMATLFASHFQANPAVVVILFTSALLVGITRIYVGAHYPRDVLAGAILGSAWGGLEMLVDGYVRNGI